MRDELRSSEELLRVALKPVEPEELVTAVSRLSGRNAALAQR